MLENFKHERLGGNEVVIMDELRERYPERFTPSGQMDWKWFETAIRPNKYIYVRRDVNSISFTLQRGDVSKEGVNGCGIEAVIEAAIALVSEIPNPTVNQQRALQHLSHELFWCKKREAASMPHELISSLINALSLELPKGTEVMKQMRNALQALSDSQLHKAKHGKDADYIRLRNDAWVKCGDALRASDEILEERDGGQS